MLCLLFVRITFLHFVLARFDKSRMPNEIIYEEIKYFCLSGVEFLCILFYIFQTLHPVMNNQFSFFFFFFSYFLRLTRTYFPYRRYIPEEKIYKLENNCSFETNHNPWDNCIIRAAWPLYEQLHPTNSRVYFVSGKED